MSRTHLRSHTLLLWLSLSAAVAALGLGCSSSSDTDAQATAGKSGGGSGGAAAHAGSGSSEAGEPAVGGDTGEGGSEDTPAEGNGGSSPIGGSGGSVAGGPASGGGSEQPGEGGAAGSADDGDAAAIAAAQARALTLINALPMDEKCTKCHDVTYQGAGFYPNITPDLDNGIGSWTLEEIKTAIRDGKNKDQETLCMTMKRYTEFTDGELNDIAVYLKHLPPRPKKISNKCPAP